MNPPKSKRLPTSPQEWMVYARSDLNLAKLGRENQDILHEQICFHAQQSVEKALKAVLLFCKVDFPLTHDIEELVDILSEVGISLPSDISDADTLTPYAVETRYPGYWEEITEQDMNESINLAEKIIVWAEEYIGSRGDKDMETVSKILKEGE